MALPKIADARKLSNEEIAEEILASKQKLFELRLQRATGRLEKFHQFKHMRHWIAQLMTVERERQLADLEEQSSPEAVTPASLASEEE
ncbi:MAG: 50S ribosomal protein L29 [Chloroflexaceae bacterium]|nr:50S ribosomal protein L29 [Chloroflexaceae bacterium]